MRKKNLDLGAEFRNTYIVNYLFVITLMNVKCLKEKSNFESFCEVNRPIKFILFST